MEKWPVRLSTFDIRYEPRSAIKSQALADFMDEFSDDLQNELDMEAKQLTYGTSNQKGTGLGIILNRHRGTSYLRQLVVNSTLPTMKHSSWDYNWLRIFKSRIFRYLGMDIVGKLPVAPGGKVFMLVMTDYFSKWFEAEASVQIPAEIICDNGSQFISKRTRDFCTSWGVKMIMSNPVHPRANGQVESSNKIIVNNLKKRMDKKKGRWAEELPFVLWADRTTSKVSTDQSPYSLVFGTEAYVRSAE
ncbi:hypothetical protein Lser_V15G28014 [Lactuca serriola]